MMDDTRDEAERIAHDLTASAFNGGRCHALGDMEGRQRWRVEEQGECDRLVAALAAAMRNHGAQAHHGLCESIGADDEMMCDCGTAELREALAALRTNQREETQP